MDKPKFELGQEVEVKFIGKITEIKFSNIDGRVVYAVDGDSWSFGRLLTENQLNKLLTPEMVVCDGK